MSTASNLDQPANFGPARDGYEPRTVAWTVTVTIGTFTGACAWCQKSTPRPTDAEVLAFAQANRGNSWMHASDWSPPGWSRVWEEGEICEDCTAALASARRNCSRRAVACVAPPRVGDRWGDLGAEQRAGCSVGTVIKEEGCITVAVWTRLPSGWSKTVINTSAATFQGVDDREPATTSVIAYLPPYTKEAPR